MLPSLLDIALAYLVTRFFVRWWAWLGLALLAGAVVSITYHIGLGLLDYVPAGVAVTRAIGGVFTHAVFAALCAWGFARGLPPTRSGPEGGPPA